MPPSTPSLVGPLAPEIYGYALGVNGVAVTRGTLDVPGAGPMFYDMRAVPHGGVEQRWYTSKATGLVRRVFVYTPPDYTRSSDRYPVLYLLHGAGGDESGWTTNGRDGSRAASGRVTRPSAAHGRRVICRTPRKAGP